MERLDRAHWKQYQLLMQDATKFVEMLHDVNLDEGLSSEVNQGTLYSDIKNNLDNFGSKFIS
jgi:hypothetical protein